jgi:nucleolar MIF4G domain-containing protein 1
MAIQTKRSRPNENELGDHEVSQHNFSKPENGYRSPKPKPILKRTKQPDKDVPAHSGLASPPRPGPKLRASQAMLSALMEEDAQISRLEKKLKMKKGTTKLPKGFEEDGLSSLLDGLDSLDNYVNGRKEVSQLRSQEMMRAISQLQELQELVGYEGGGRDDEEMESEEEESDFEEAAWDLENVSADENELDEVDDDHDVEDDEEGDEDDDEESDSDQENDCEVSANGKVLNGTVKRVKENPYLPPTTGKTEKYVPPSLRNLPSSDSQALQILRRQTQGLLNRLSEANILVIVGELEKLYLNNPRGDVTDTISDLVLTSIADRATLNDQLLILYAGLTSALYKILGTDYGAVVVQRTVNRLDKAYSNIKASDVENQASKEATNLISFLAQLYNFQLIGSNLIFDYIRLFLQNISEVNTEMLLRVIRGDSKYCRDG